MEKSYFRDMKKLIFFCIAALAAVSCNNAGTKSGKDGKDKAVESGIPVFNSDSCYAFVEKQTGFGPRVPGSNAHSECAAYFEDFFNRLGLETEIQEAKLSAWDGKVINAKNIIASVNPEAKARIFICAHWDSRPWCDEDPDPANHGLPVMGANDGASGAGVIMELARMTAATPPAIGVDFILFDAEDYGNPAKEADSYCLGSQYWARNLDKSAYKPNFGILLDMVGAEDAIFFREGVSEQYASFVNEMVWRRAHELGYASKFVNKKVGGIIDDHYFINSISGIPCIDIIDYNDERGFPSVWHTSGDTMENISKSTLSVVGDVLTHIIYELR